MAQERTILHCDMNCFYASCEMAYHPELQGKPIAVCGDPERRSGIILTASRASVSQRRRQIILKELLDSGKYTKWEITEKISEFIKLRKNNPDMRDAIKRWEEDIAFVADYDTDNQTKVGRATFKQGGKITRR